MFGRILKFEIHPSGENYSDLTGDSRGKMVVKSKGKLLLFQGNVAW